MWNNPFKINIIQGMVLYQQGQPLFRWIHRRTFGDDPRPQNAFQLQAEIVVEMRGIVLVNDKTGAHHIAFKTILLTMRPVLVQGFSKRPV